MLIELIVLFLVFLFVIFFVASPRAESILADPHDEYYVPRKRGARVHFADTRTEKIFDKVSRKILKEGIIVPLDPNTGMASMLSK